MRGNKWQIALAESYVAAILPAIEVVKERCKHDDYVRPRRDFILCVFDVVAKNLSECDSASDIISLYSGVKWSDSAEENSYLLVKVWRSRKPEGDVQKLIHPSGYLE